MEGTPRERGVPMFDSGQKETPGISFLEEGVVGKGKPFRVNPGVGGIC